MEKNHLIDLLHEGNYSCVIEKNGEIRTFKRRGIIDIYELYQDDPSFLKGASIADKVLGKGAAALLVLGGIGQVYADVISTSASTLLSRMNIPISYGQEVPFIINRKGNGKCPLETACADIDRAEDIYPVIENFVENTFYNGKKNS